MSDDSTFLLLAEMFPNLPLDVIDRIIHTARLQHSQPLLGASHLQSLIDRCLAEESAAGAPQSSQPSAVASVCPTSPSASASSSSSSSSSPAPSASSSSASPSSSAAAQSDGFEMTSLVPATSGLPEPSAPTVSTEHFALMSAFADIHGAVLAALTPQPPSQPAASAQLLRCLGALQRLVTNVLEQPAVDRYRVLPLSNPHFQAKILSLPGSTAALAALGFVQAEGSDVLVMSDDRYDRQLLEEGQRYVEDEIAFVSSLQPPAQSAVPASTKASSPYARYSSVTDNPLYRSKRDWHKDSARPLHFPLVATPRLSRDQLAALAEHRLRPKSTPAPTLPPGAGGEARQGRVMRLEGMRRRRAEVEAMRAEARERHWSTTAAGRKRTFTLDDIARMRRDELDTKARLFGGMATDAHYESIGREAVRLTNAFRQQQGVRAEVEWSARVAEIGWKHSKLMGDGERPFSHDRFSERAAEMGCAASGENVFMCKGGMEAGHVAKLAVDGWIHSPGHRKNLLGERWAVCGIGVYRNEHGAWYLTQLFGSG